MDEQNKIIEFIKALNDPTSPFFVPRHESEIVPVKGSKNGIKLYKGHLLPMVCRNPTVQKNMDVREDDTFVITFPKSGTHWVSEICWLIQNNLDFEKARVEKHAWRTPFLDMGSSNNFLNLMPSPRVFMTHFEIPLLPDNLNKKAKVVYVVRNPKDVLVSLYHFIKTVPDDEYEGTFEDFFEYYAKGEVAYGGWWDHVNSYTQLEGIHILHYEELLENPMNELRSLGKYLGKELTDEQVKSIIDFCSFDKLRKNPAFELKAPGGFLKQTILSNENNGQQPPKMKEFNIFRKGQIGDWKNYLTDEMSKTIDNVVANKLTYKKPFKYEPSV